MVAAAVRTIFAQPDAEHVTEQFEVIATMLGKQLPQVEQMLRDAHHDLLAFAGFPVAHWKKIWSTNPLERLNKEVNAAPMSSGSSPTPAGAVLVEAHDEWQSAPNAATSPNARWPWWPPSPRRRWPSPNS